MAEPEFIFLTASAAVGGHKTAIPSGATQGAKNAVRYHFHIQDQGLLILDEEGIEMSGIADACIEARASALDLAMDDLRSGRAIDDRRIVIADENGTVVETVSVRELILTLVH
jgi:hypothetical protein